MSEEMDRPHEACGVFGIYAPGADVARIAFFALYALQHRGQESAGIATSDGRAAYIHKGMGLVAQVFNEDNLAPLKGHLALGHNRYSTTGSSHIRNAQPYLIETMVGPLGVGHNGNLTNALTLRRKLLARGVGLTSSSDSEVITQMLAAPPPGGEPNGADWEARIAAFMAESEGAYSLVILTRDAVFAVRDPLGLRPLCLGELTGGNGSSGYVVASESCALGTIDARCLREVRPGEIVRLDANGLHSTQGREPAARPALCIFEYVYFARPDSVLEQQTIHRVRQRLGEELAREAPADADVVIGVPDSATPAAIGYAQKSGIPYSEGLTKNRYIGRTFIQPDDRLRRAGVHLKYNPLMANLAGKRVVMVDDSIVRGNTVGPMVRLLRDGGAAEVHVRVSSPPVRHPCFMGVDMATHEELIAHHQTIEEIRRYVGADSLAYLSHEGMVRAVTADMGEDRGHCSACFTGNYPVRLEEWWEHQSHEKLVFEGIWGA
jgi:amidophosphoribosyltransferase